MYKNSPAKGKNMKAPPGYREGQPPDLFRDHDLELKNLDKAESTLTISTRRNSHDSSSIHTNNQGKLFIPPFLPFLSLCLFVCLSKLFFRQRFLRNYFTQDSENWYKA